MFNSWKGQKQNEAFTLKGVVLKGIMSRKMLGEKKKTIFYYLTLFTGRKT